jgi:hypothetical protein
VRVAGDDRKTVGSLGSSASVTGADPHIGEFLMNMLNRSALASGAAVSVIALTDAAWRALDSNPPPWDESFHHTTLAAVITVAHVLVYLLCAAILLRYAPEIDVNPVARWTRRLLAADFLVLSAAYVVYLTVWDATTPEDGMGAAVFGISFGLMFVLPTMLGLALLRRPVFRICALVLASPLLIIPLVVALAAFTKWGHPGYAETAVYLGVPLLGLAAEAVVTVQHAPHGNHAGVAS